MAKRITAAPNLHGAATPQDGIAGVWKQFLPPGSTNPCVELKIPVGPPDATVAAASLAPRNYNLQFTSKVDRTAKGQRTLSLMLATNVAGSFTPLEQPATVVLLHGYMLYKETMAPWAVLLAQAGYRVVTVDLRGHGQSSGSEISFGKYETTDLIQVLDYLKEHGLCDDRIGAMGYSYGATLALHWAAHDPRVRTVVALAPYNRPDEAVVRCAKALKISMPRGVARKALAMASQKLEVDWEQWSGAAAARHVTHPVLLVGASKDTICPPDDIALIKDAAPAGSKSIVIPEANHQVLGMWLHELGEPIKAWFHDQLQSGYQAAAN